LASESAFCSVSESWLSSWHCSSPPSWDCDATWLVLASLLADESAELSAVCVALPPREPLTASWLALASESAFCSVSESWLSVCVWLEPTQNSQKYD
jgi:hypothetical protein